MAETIKELEARLWEKYHAQRERKKHLRRELIARRVTGYED